MPAKRSKAKEASDKTVPDPAPVLQRAPVILRTLASETPVSEEGMSLLPRLAIKWSRTVATRERWDGSQRDRLKVEQEAVEDLERLLGQSPSRLAETIGLQRILEISILWGQDEAYSWPARVMPWEFLIASATRSVRKGARLLVVRHLDCSLVQPPAPSTPSGIEDGLVICSTPSIIGHGLQKSLIEESRVAASIWNRDGIVVHQLNNPGLDELAKGVSKGASWMHVLGVNGNDLQSEAFDSIVLSGETQDNIVMVTADEIRKLVANSSKKPAMAVFNFCNSSARLAASAVAGGAGAALGFQDMVSDQTCMDVVGVFYPALKRRGGDVLKAFIDLWEGMEASLCGTVVVLWSAHSLLGGITTEHLLFPGSFEAVSPTTGPAAGTGTGTSPEVSVSVTGDLAADPGTRSSTGTGGTGPGAAGTGGTGTGGTGGTGAGGPGTDSTCPGGTGTGTGTGTGGTGTGSSMDIYGIPDFLDVKLDIAKAVNFSLLHNECSFFRQFEIGKAYDKPMRDVLIEVSVNDGGQTSSWRMLRTFKRSGVCIAKDVQLAFVSGMVRSLRESLSTTLYISISCGGRLLFNESRLVRLLAIDEWVDDDENRRWLPSFVHPRDAAVADIITRAEGYLQALCDDFGAGFDGYQAEEEMVDGQIRALWVALSRDCRIRYINPPPTYTKASQRLRRPGEIVSTRQGTCLDLALLLSACMEWIGVYPVIFLISGHAFPGYWRSEEAYRNFYDPAFGAAAPAPVAQAPLRPASADTVQQRRWMSGKEETAAVLREVQAGRLVPLETVWLTNSRSFADALDAGRNNLFQPQAFEYLVDVQRARENNVTPLPLPDKI